MMSEVELLKLVIENAVEKGIAAAIKPLQEELKKVKALTAQVLKEGRERPVTVLQEAPMFQQLPKVNIVPVMNKARESQVLTEKKDLLARAHSFAGTDEIPDMDISEDLIMSMLSGK